MFATCCDFSIIPNSGLGMKRIILTERSEKQDRKHNLVIRIVEYGSAWHNLGSLCLGEDKASNPCSDRVHLDLRYDSGRGKRYLIGEIQAQGGNFRGEPAVENDGALQVGSGPKAQQPCVWPKPGDRSLPQGRTPRGASACWAGVVYESWRSYRRPEHAVAYLKRYFDVLADGFNETYTQEWIDQECNPPSPEEYSNGQALTDGARPAARTETRDSSGPVTASASLPPPLPEGFSHFDILKRVVRWIHEDPFQRRRRYSGQISGILGAPVVRGWENRVKEYAYAKQSGPHFAEVYRDVLPIIKELDSIRSAHAWIGTMAEPPTAVVSSIARIAERICLWGGVAQEDYRDAWKVLRDAISAQDHGARMNSGWTKVAAFATDGMPGNEQTIWDSRVATSIIWRIDQILAGATGIGIISKSSAQDIVDGFGLGTVASLNVGTRPRTLTFRWPNGYGKWNYHFSGSCLVREMVAILNDPENAYPRMPKPTFDANWNHTGQQNADWTVFGAGLVLFMDGW
jgi:hypothetical protein